MVYLLEKREYKVSHWKQRRSTITADTVVAGGLDLRGASSWVFSFVSISKDNSFIQQICYKT